MAPSSPAGPAETVTGGASQGDDGSVTSDDLSEAITQLHAAEVVIHQRLLDVIRAYDDDGLWKQDGAANMAQWLVARLGIAQSTAHEWVRVSQALADLPAIAEVAGEGRLSWDQLAPLTRLATPATDRALAGGPRVERRRDQGPGGSLHCTHCGRCQSGSPAPERPLVVRSAHGAPAR